MEEQLAAAPYTGMHARPLVIQFGHLGDTVMLLTMMRGLRARFGTPVDLVCPQRAMRTFLQHQPDVGVLHTIRSKRDPYWITPEQWRLVSALRRRGPGPTWIIDGHNIGKGRWLARRAGIPDSLIVDELTCPLVPGEHQVDRWCRFAHVTPPGLHGLSNARDEQAELCALRVPPLAIAPAWRADVDQWLERRGSSGRPLVLIQAGCKRTTKWGRGYGRPTNDKYWPAEHWARVIDEIAALEPDVHLLLLGVPNEVRMNRAILRKARTRRAQNVAGDLPVTRLFALQERAIGTISVDTGPAHSAGALGCPVVVLFGAEDPTVFRPRSSTGMVECLVGFVAGEQSILGIRPDEVVDAWLRLRGRSALGETLAPLRSADIDSLDQRTVTLGLRQ
ncbi:MAG: glycosyltransferase family 9 protein [Gammaproteobacteria bacterium]